MATKSSLNVEVGDSETEIIESTHTSTESDRTFGVGNGDKEIIATAWGSDDEENWFKEESKTVAAHAYKILIVGLHHYPYVKLTGRTTTSGQTSIIDGYLTYEEP